MLTHSPELHAGQSRSMDQTLAKAEAELTKIADVLHRGRGRRTRAQLETAVAKITGKRWVRGILITTITGDAAAELRLTWRIDSKTRNTLEARFGKRILITDRHDRSRRRLPLAIRREFGFVICQGDGTTCLPGAWDHLGCVTEDAPRRWWRQGGWWAGCVGGRRGLR